MIGRNAAESGSVPCDIYIDLLAAGARKADCANGGIPAGLHGLGEEAMDLGTGIWRDATAGRPASRG